MEWMLEFRDGGTWVTQGRYGSEMSVMSALDCYDRARPCRDWRVLEVREKARLVIYVKPSACKK